MRAHRHESGEDAFDSSRAAAPRPPSLRFRIIQQSSELTYSKPILSRPSLTKESAVSMSTCPLMPSQPKRFHVLRPAQK